MPNNIEETLSVIIDTNPKMIKPILYTTYEAFTKYNIHIVYEDETTKDIELVQRDKERPYRFIFKREGKLITATGVPTIHEINECHKMCDFANRIMDSNDLLIELDCSNEYECNKVRFYLKDVRDIVDLANEEPEDSDDIVKEDKIYSILVNGLPCENKIYCQIGDNNNILIHPMIMKLGEFLLKEEYDDLEVYSLSPYVEATAFNKKINDDELDMLAMIISDDGLDKEIKIVIRYFVKEINHPVFDEFTIIASKTAYEGDNGSTQQVLSRAVATSDMQYLGDGLKPALGVGITPGYKEYKNKKSYNKSVLESAT